MATTRKRAKPKHLSEAEFQELLHQWDSLPAERQHELFNTLDRWDAQEIFLSIGAHAQALLFKDLPAPDRRAWIRLLAPDDAADLIQELSEEERPQAFEFLDRQSRMEVHALLAYKEDVAGGLMNPRYARLRPDMSTDQALRYLREQTRAQVETIYYAYVLDHWQKLLGAVSLRDLFVAPKDSLVSDIMVSGDHLVTVRENQPQEEITRLFAQNEHRAVPVIDDEGRMKGIITVDDVVEVIEEEATEDIQKMGGVQALEEPYFKVSFLDMIKKRAVWLLVLFVGEMFTATAMGYYEHEIEKAVVLALFVPLIMSSGGNSGSQATTLVIRAMALGEVRLRDWWRVMGRELLSGLTLGLILGLVGLIRVVFWPHAATVYGQYYETISLAIGFSLVGIVTWGTLMGSMLPLALRRLNLDPATASAPLVATLVDVTGLVIYFSVASMFLKGTLL